MVDAQEARKVAEDAREKVWSGDSFMKDVFLGNFRMDLLEKLSLDDPDRPEFWEFYRKLADFLQNEVDSIQIDETGEYPPRSFEGSRSSARLG